MATPAKWPLKQLSELAEFRNGINYTKTSFGEGVKVIGVKNFQDYTKPRFDELEQINPEGVVTERNILRDGDIIFVRSNGNRQLIGRSLYIAKPTEQVTHSAFTIRLRFTSSEVDPHFYAYVFRSPLIRKGFAAFGGGTNISNLNQDILNRLEVPFPSLPVQRRITAVLSAYDDLIENNTRRIQILERMAQALYREWFVNFRFPGHAQVKLVDSPLGTIPQGWEVQPLETCCHLVMGQSPASEFYNERGDGLPFHQGVTDFGEHFPTDRVFCTVNNRIAENGDILFSVRAPVGRINLADKRIVIGRGVSAIRSRSGKQTFLLFQLKDKFKEEDSMGGGTIFKSVTKEDMQKISLLLPPSDLVEQFESIARPMVTLLEDLTNKNANLRRTRDLLLPKLISGAMDVSKLDIETPQ